MRTMQNRVFLPQNLPQMSTGKNTFKIVLRKDTIDKQGKYGIYLQLYDGKIKRRSLARIFYF